MSIASGIANVLKDSCEEDELRETRIDLSALTDTGKIQFVNELVAALPEAEDDDPKAEEEAEKP